MSSRKHHPLTATEQAQNAVRVFLIREADMRAFSAWDITTDKGDEDGRPFLSIRPQGSDGLCSHSAHWDERGWAVFSHDEDGYMAEVTRSPDLKQALTSALA